MTPKTVELKVTRMDGGKARMAVLFGVGLPDENSHAPNEKLDLANFHGGVIASAFLYDEVARLTPAGP